MEILKRRTLNVFQAWQILGEAASLFTFYSLARSAYEKFLAELKEVDPEGTLSRIEFPQVPPEDWGRQTHDLRRRAGLLEKDLSEALPYLWMAQPPDELMRAARLKREVPALRWIMKQYGMGLNNAKMAYAEWSSMWEARFES